MTQISFNDFLVANVSKTPAKAAILDFLKYKPTDITENDINIFFISRFQDYLINRNLAANSRRLYSTILQTAIVTAKRKGYPITLDIDDAKKESKIKKEASESIYITKDELIMLEKYKPASKTEKFCKSIFLLCSYTGCRISDGIILTINNINNNELNYTSIKTKATSRIPMHPMVPELIEICKGSLYDEDSLRVVVGATIKTIFKKLGVDQMVTLYRRGDRTTQPKYKFIGTHTARKSFATNMLLDGYAIEQISRMMNHDNITMTMKYICISNSDVIVGDKTYLNPRKVDASFIQMNQLIELGNTKEVSLKIMSVMGCSNEEIERLKLIE